MALGTGLLVAQLRLPVERLRAASGAEVMTGGSGHNVVDVAVLPEIRSLGTIEAPEPYNFVPCSAQLFVFGTRTR